MKNRYQQLAFIFYYVSFVLILIIAISVGLLTYIYMNSNWSFFIIFILLIMLTFFAYYFKKKLYIIIHQNYIFQIRADVLDPIEINKNVTFDTLYEVYKSLHYKLHYHDKQLVVFTHIVHDPIRKVFAHHILNVAVFNLTNKSSFYQEKTDDIINDIQFNSQSKDKKRIDRILITQYQIFDEFTEEVRNQINEILFVKTEKHLVSTINVGVFVHDQIALMLASKLYSPSIYYRLQVDEILHVIKKKGVQ